MQNNGYLLKVDLEDMKAIEHRHFLICVDVSGSMNCEAGPQTNSETNGFSRLDLVKHSLKTVI